MKGIGKDLYNNSHWYSGTYLALTKVSVQGTFLGWSATDWDGGMGIHAWLGIDESDMAA